MPKDKKFDVKIREGMAKEVSSLEVLQARMDKAIKKMLKQTKQLKKGLDVGYTKARKKAGLLPERNIPTVKKAMGGVMKNRGGTFKGTF